MSEFSSCSCKVGRAIDKYELSGLDSRLRREYVEEDASLRDLEETVNMAIWTAAMNGLGAGRDLPDMPGTQLTEPGTDERLLTFLKNPDGSRDAARLRTRLEQQGVDVDELLSDLVSYQTVRKHLNECLDVGTGRSESITLESAHGTISWAQSRCEGVIDSTLKRLASVDKIVLSEDFDVRVSPLVTCDVCGVSMSVTELLSEGGCDCDS